MPAVHSSLLARQANVCAHKKREKKNGNAIVPTTHKLSCVVTFAQWVSGEHEIRANVVGGKS